MIIMSPGGVVVCYVAVHIDPTLAFFYAFIPKLDGTQATDLLTGGDECKQ